MNTLRMGLALAAGGVMVGLALWSAGAGRVDGPARVEAVSEYRVTHAGDGRVRWSLLDGTAPGGPVVVADGVMQGDRGDPIEIERLVDQASGSRVEVGQAVARIRAPQLEEEAGALQAEAQALAAEEALLQAGGRPETVARAQQAVQVAEASLARTQAEVDHLDALVARGAEAAWVAQEAGRDLEVRQAELALARAELQEARLEPRDPELDAVRARRAAIEARLAAARSRREGEALKSPISGSLELPGGDTLVSVLGDGAPVLQVAVGEGWHDRIGEGDRVRFSPTADVSRSIEGHVLAIGSSAASLGGQPVVWVVASLDQPVPVGSTGRARVFPGQGAP